MKKEMVKRVLEEADIILKTKETIREISKKFKISKSTVHKDLSERLPLINEKKYKDVQKLMQQHIDIRHLRGGEATRIKHSLKSV